MFSNIPTMLQDYDFHARHRDMLESARRGPMSQSEIEQTRAMVKMFPELLKQWRGNLSAAQVVENALLSAHIPVPDWVGKPLRSLCPHSYAVGEWDPWERL